MIMELRRFLFLTIFVAVFAHTQSLFSNPLALSALRGVVKNEENKIVDNVRRMQIKNPFSSMLLRGQPINANMPKLGKSSKLRAPFNWTSCGPSNQTLEIKSLMIKPSPLSFPGTLTFAFDLVFHDNIDKTDNITADVKIEFNPGSTWIKLPCLGTVGSCTYDDLCSQLSGLSCPPDITKAGVRCNCPFPKGEYKLQPYSVEIDASVFIPGDYRAIANLTTSTKGKEHIGCYKLAFSVD